MKNKIGRERGKGNEKEVKKGEEKEMKKRERNGE